MKRRLSTSRLSIPPPGCSGGIGTCAPAYVAAATATASRNARGHVDDRAEPFTFASLRAPRASLQREGVGASRGCGRYFPGAGAGDDAGAGAPLPVVLIGAGVAGR